MSKPLATASDVFLAIKNHTSIELVTQYDLNLMALARGIDWALCSKLSIPYLLEELLDKKVLEVLALEADFLLEMDMDEEEIV